MPKLQTSKGLKNLETLRTDSKWFLNKTLFMTKIYVTYLLKILHFFSPFRQFEMKNFLHRPIMVDNILYLVALW